MDTLGTISIVLNKYEGIAAAYLFGSQASGNATSQSDIDIAVLFSPETSHQAATLRFKLYADLSKALQRNDIDLVILNTSRNTMLQEDIVRNGRIIIDRDAEYRFDYEWRALHEGIDFRQQRMMVMGV